MISFFSLSWGTPLAYGRVAYDYPLISLCYWVIRWDVLFKIYWRGMILDSVSGTRSVRFHGYFMLRCLRASSSGSVVIHLSFQSRASKAIELILRNDACNQYKVHSVFLLCHSLSLCPSFLLDFPNTKAWGEKEGGEQGASLIHVLHIHIMHEHVPTIFLSAPQPPPPPGRPSIYLSTHHICSFLNLKSAARRETARIAVVAASLNYRVVIPTFYDPSTWVHIQIYTYLLQPTTHLIHIL